MKKAKKVTKSKPGKPAEKAPHYILRVYNIGGVNVPKNPANPTKAELFTYLHFIDGKRLAAEEKYESTSESRLEKMQKMLSDMENTLNNLRCN